MTNAELKQRALKIYLRDHRNADAYASIQRGMGRGQRYVIVYERAITSGGVQISKMASAWPIRNGKLGRRLPWHMV